MSGVHSLSDRLFKFLESVEKFSKFKILFSLDLKNRKMEAATLASGLSKISGLGVGLNQTQQSALDTSVIIAQVIQNTGVVMV